MEETLCYPIFNFIQVEIPEVVVAVNDDDGDDVEVVRHVVAKDISHVS